MNFSVSINSEKASFLGAGVGCSRRKEKEKRGGKKKVSMM
jgi:hypothetical protein